jgi:hypothetical protein
MIALPVVADAEFYGVPPPSADSAWKYRLALLVAGESGVIAEVFISVKCRSRRYLRSNFDSKSFSLKGRLFRSASFIIRLSAIPINGQ